MLKKLIVMFFILSTNAFAATQIEVPAKDLIDAQVTKDKTFVFNVNTRKPLDLLNAIGLANAAVKTGGKVQFILGGIGAINALKNQYDEPMILLPGNKKSVPVSKVLNKLAANEKVDVYICALCLQRLKRKAKDFINNAKIIKGAHAVYFLSRENSVTLNF